MRFYVPEWDDAVDAHYDFEHDELSSVNRSERELSYIWDIFEYDTTPIDGVLISREQVETTTRKSDRLRRHGVYDDPILAIPDWLPTISDCGAWGYKSLPFPPYDNTEMLDFYETLDVSVGVTIDHLVLGSGKDKGRLYLDERAFTDGFSKSDIPDWITDVVDLMVDEWPTEWPSYVDEYEPSIRTRESISPFTRADFEGEVDTVLSTLASDSRAVYRSDDASFRYDLTLDNAEEMYEQYQAGDYSFRLMVAIQGWDPSSYVEALESVLSIGYDYVGIGGVAGSPIHDVRKIVKSVGKSVKDFEREHTCRIDTHVFGFAKTEGFDAVGRSGMTSFDSASMLRSAWTGGDNYRLTNDERYDAIRVRYPSSRDSLHESVEKSLRGRELLVALRAYDARRSISAAVDTWCETAATIIPETREYLREHRHEDQYDQSLLQDIEEAFRDDFEYARELQASFSDALRGKLVKLLRKDSPEDPVPFAEYDELLNTAATAFSDFPRIPALIEDTEPTPLERIWTAVEDYATWIGDDDLLEDYRRTLTNRPWESCECPICSEHGIEVCIFRGNDRNRRRGFHNTRRFYDEFTDAIPKILVAVQGSAGLSRYDTIEDYLRNEEPEFWEAVHDLPVAEIGVFDAAGVREWWTETGQTVSFAPTRMRENLQKQANRYQHLFLVTPDGDVDDEIGQAVAASNCELQTFSNSTDLRREVLEACGEDYVVGDDFVPHVPQVDPTDGLNILVVDQCSGSKEFPDGAPVFDAEETLEYSREELLERDNVPEIAARDLYTGRQQKYVREAVRTLRDDGHDVSRYFISAGFGLVSETELLPPYEVTFSSMNVGEIRHRSSELNIRPDLEAVLKQGDYDVVFFTLGSDYYTSIDIDSLVRDVPADQIGVVFNRDLVNDQYDNIVSVGARTEDAKNHGTIVVGLKGVYLKNFARRVGTVDSLDPDLVETLCREVVDGPTQAALEQY
ncbi:queuine tRNA-ribosyltransferase tRNA-guanine transglycosylase [Haloferax sp. AB510]|uniref:queuine tRNA-ribosyltransferase tRNA-guanine transglycosylase n=1 Tax=Haloferax sp. AB510 TaxID=2934172 RepID=UPI00209C074B|nr:queuine tRNA-ribosyltransferase tRNA-guanine transglycosylase [Haloferax sp. AB510]MCO8266298.1 queuine tRNA-ribosyltransferase tRNA-guanine transglycosylase [Haloferax sp. AB510]